MERMLQRSTLLIGAFLVALVACSNVPGPGSKGPEGDSDDVKPREIPSFVAVVDKESGKMVTGGILLHDQVVLTLGSSFVNSNAGDLSVVLGVVNRTQGVPGGHQTVDVAEIALNPDLSDSGEDPIEGDLALIKMASPAIRGPNVWPFGLENIKGKKNRRSKRRASRVKSRYLSFAFLRQGAVPTLDAEMLQRFRPHVKDTSTCEMMAGLRDFPWDRRTWYCSMEDGFASTCSGDGGEPLFKGSRLRGFELQGLVPRRTPDYCYNSFTVYTRVCNYYTWIVETTHRLENDD